MVRAAPWPARPSLRSIHAFGLHPTGISRSLSSSITRLEAHRLVHPRPVLSVLAGLLACGLPLWPIPYREVSLPGNPAPGVWILLGALAGLLAAHLLRPGVRTPVLAVTAGFVLAVLLRVTSKPRATRPALRVSIALQER